MKVLLLYPEFPDTFWSFRHAFPFIGKRSADPPPGLLAVSAMIARRGARPKPRLGCSGYLAWNKR